MVFLFDCVVLEIRLWTSRIVLSLLKRIIYLVVKIVIHFFFMILMICFALFEFWLSQCLQNRFNVNPSLPGVSFTYFLKTEKIEKGTLGSNGLKMIEKDLGNYDSGKNIPYWWSCTFFLEIGTLFFVILETVLDLSFILRLIDCC